MNSLDVYQVLNDKEKMICCAWKSEHLAVELIQVISTDQIIYSIKAELDIEEEYKTKDYQCPAELKFKWLRNVIHLNIRKDAMQNFLFF